MLSLVLDNHGNSSIPPRVDKILRLFLVTPDMHRPHHCVMEHEFNSNFGFNFPWWDRLFGSYRDQPEGGHCTMEMGVRGFQRAEDQMLALSCTRFTGGLRRSLPKCAI